MCVLTYESEREANSLKIIVILAARMRVREEQRITKLNKYTNMLLDKQARVITKAYFH